MFLQEDSTKQHGKSATTQPSIFISQRRTIMNALAERTSETSKQNFFVRKHCTAGNEVSSVSAVENLHLSPHHLISAHSAPTAVWALSKDCLVTRSSKQKLY